MKMYDRVLLTVDFEDYKEGAIGIIVEMYNDECYLEMIDENDETIGMLYDVPIKILKKIN